GGRHNPAGLHEPAVPALRRRLLRTTQGARARGSAGRPVPQRDQPGAGASVALRHQRVHGEPAHPGVVRRRHLPVLPQPPVRPVRALPRPPPRPRSRGAAPPPPPSARAGVFCGFGGALRRRRGAPGGGGGPPAIPRSSRIVNSRGSSAARPGRGSFSVGSCPSTWRPRAAPCGAISFWIKDSAGSPSQLPNRCPVRGSRPVRGVHGGALPMHFDTTGKVALGHIYTQPDPRAYFGTLRELDYRIPELAKPYFAKLIEESREARGT